MTKKPMPLALQRETYAKASPRFRVLPLNDVFGLFLARSEATLPPCEFFEAVCNELVARQQSS